MSVAIADPAENGIALCLKRNDNGQMKYNLRTVSVLSIVRRKKYSYAKVDAGRRKISDRKLGNAFRINHCKKLGRSENAIIMRKGNALLSGLQEHEKETMDQKKICIRNYEIIIWAESLLEMLSFFLLDICINLSSFIETILF